MLRYFTAGESHGEALVAFLSGLPAGLAVDVAFLDRELWRRQQGYGRGGRMKIETDKAHILSGVRHGADHRLADRHSAGEQGLEELAGVSAGGDGRPGQAQAGGVAAARPRRSGRSLKYNFSEARYVLERASARESAARVALARSGQAVSAGTGHRSAEPRGCGGRCWLEEECLMGADSQPLRS